MVAEQEETCPVPLLGRTASAALPSSPRALAESTGPTVQELELESHHSRWATETSICWL